MARNRFFPETEDLSHGAIGSGIRTVDEAGVSPLDRGETDGSGPTPGFIGTSVSRWRLMALFSAFVLILLGLGGRAAWLDLAQGAHYRGLAEGNRIRIVPIEADRGIIRDRDGRLLVRNIPDFILTVTPADLPKDDSKRLDVIAQLAETAEMTPVDVERALAGYPDNFTGAVPIRDHLSYDKAALLDVLSGAIPGAAVTLGTTREYLLNDPQTQKPILSLSHVLGYLGRVNENDLAQLNEQGYSPTDSIGKAGVEDSYENELRGTAGRKQIEVDALGREQATLAEDAPVHGEDLTLSIDLDLQAAAEKALGNAAKKASGRGVAIALNPKTGEILAIVSFPGYDDNLFAQGISSDDYRKLSEDPNQPLFPRAISGLYPPGSTVKLAISAVALADHVITPTTSFLSTGGIAVGKWFFPDWKVGGHGITNVVKAIADSINTFFYAVGGGWNNFVGLGIDRLGQGLKLFGLGQKLGIDLPGEQGGFIPTPAWKLHTTGEAWFIGDTYNTSIGQGGLLVTPLQVADWTAVFANGGDLVVPHVVKELVGAKTTETVPTTYVRKQLVSPADVETVREGMRQTILSGSAQSLKTSPWNIAGKTGTAQWNKSKPNHAWFTGFAPFEDPQIVVTVLVEAGGEGSTAAVPVARDIIEAWLRKQKVPPSRPDYVGASTSSNEVFHD
jgi:penicillin-binding protein 2